jgi:itaconate CoA-transferase
MGQALLSVPADEALRRLAEASIAVARVNDLDDVWQHEQLRGRERFHEVRIPGGTAEMLSSPFGGSVEGAWVPDLDEHDADLVAQLVERGRDRLHAAAR